MFSCRCTILEKFADAEVFKEEKITTVWSPKKLWKRREKLYVMFLKTVL